MRCRLVAVVLLATLVPAPAPAATPAYLLSPEEVAIYRALDGKLAGDALGGSGPDSGPLDRVVRHIVDRRGGKYSGNNWTVRQTFYAYIGNSNSVVIEDGRYVFGSGCRWHSCDEKAAFLIDMGTGHVAIGIIHYFDVAGKDFGGRLTLFAKTCIDGAFLSAARGRFRQWAGGALKEDIKDDRIDVLTTRCDSAPPPAVTPAAKIPAPPPPPYRLTEAEIADFRSKAGGPSEKLVEGVAAYRAVKRTMAAIADKAGYYAGRARVDRHTMPSAFYDFYGTIVFNRLPSRLVADRFLVAGGCDGRVCWHAGSLAVDLKTGDIAAAIMHRVDARGVTFYDRGRLTIFRAACADAEFVEFITTHFIKWSEDAIWQPEDPSLPPRPAPSIAVTPCR